MINLKGYWSVSKSTEYEQYQLDNTNDINRSESNCIYKYQYITILYTTLSWSLCCRSCSWLNKHLLSSDMRRCISTRIASLRSAWAIHQWSWICELGFQIKKLGMGRDDTNGRLPIEQPFILAMSCFCAKVAAKAIADASLAWTKSMSVVFRVFRILGKPPTRFDCLKPGCQAGLPKDYQNHVSVEFGDEP